MNVISFLGRCVRLGALALIVQACCLGGTAVSALQNVPTLILSSNPKLPTGPLDTIVLRPNTEQSLFVYVKNPGEEAQKLTVVAKSADGTELARAAVVAAPGNKETRVKFPKVEPPKAEK